MGAALVAALLVSQASAGLTPEQEVEAWQPPLAQREITEREAREAALRVSAVVAPLAGLLGGATTGVATAFAGGALRLPWEATAALSVAAGVAAFDGILALGLGLFLPAGLPSWTLPVAVAAATAAGAAGLALGAGLSYAYVSVTYAGSDCFCGGDLVLIPLAMGGLMTAGAVAGTSLTLMAADME